MKKNVYNLLLVVLVLGILYFQKNVTNEIREAITLFQNNIFPSLFPFMVLSPFFIHYGFFDFIRKALGPLFKTLFKVSESSAYLFFMSIISGFPSSANYAKNLYEENHISKEEAFHTLLFSHFSNPIFIFSMVPERPGTVLFAHYFSNILIGICLRFHKPLENKTDRGKRKENHNFFEIFTGSIKNAMQNSLFVLGVIVFFFMLNAIFDFPVTHLLLELSQGLSYVKDMEISPLWISLFSAFLLSFGGFSVHLQIYGILSDWKLPYFPYLLTRIVHGILSSILVLIII